MIKIEVKNNTELPIPNYKTSGSAAVDLHAAVKDSVVLIPGESTLIPSGIHIALPQGYEAQIRPRSGLALKHGITIVNTPGTIDSDYRGEIGIILINHGKSNFEIKRGDRVAQMTINRVERVEFVSVKELDETRRGHGSFGSTGVNCVEKEDQL